MKVFVYITSKVSIKQNTNIQIKSHSFECRSTVDKQRKSQDKMRETQRSEMIKTKNIRQKFHFLLLIPTT